MTTKEIFSQGVKYSNLTSFIKKQKKATRQNLLARENKIRKGLKTLQDKQDQAEKKKSDIRNGKEFNLSGVEYRKLQEKAESILACFHSNYSMGEYRWLRIGEKVFATSHNLREYAKSCKYSPNYGTIEITLTMNQLRQIEIIGGIPTIKHENSKISKCSILRDSSTKKYVNTIELDDSFYITADYHGLSYEECLDWRKQRALRLISNRIQNQETENKLKKFVGFQHSVQAGNCEIGTKAFAEKHGLDPEMGYSLKYLKELDKNNHFIDRILTNIS